MKRALVAFLLIAVATPLAAKTIRLRGTVAGAYDAPLTIRVGSGPYEDAAMRRLGAWNVYGLGTPGGGLGGIAVPPSPSRWHSAAVDGSAFLSDAIDAEPPPFVVAFDAKKRLSIVEVAVPETAAEGAIVDVGALTLRPTALVTVDLEKPLTDLPMVFLLGVPTAEGDERRRDEIARHLSVLDQVAPRTFDVLATGDLLVLPRSGRAVLEALPPFEALTVAITDTDAGVEVVRDVALSSEAAVHVTRAELTPKTFESRRIAGKILGADGRPVRGATVVVSDFPTRREAMTANDGSFVIPSVLTGPKVNVYVDARRAIPPAPRGTFARNVRLDEGEITVRVETGPALPSVGGSTLAGPGGIKPCTPDLQYPAVGALRSPDTSSQGWGPMTLNSVDSSALTINVTTASGGAWRFLWAADPFQVVQGDANGQLTKQTVKMAAPRPSIPRALRFVDDKKAEPLAKLTVYFSSPVGDPDPVTLVTDSDGLIKLPCVNLASLPIVIDDGVFRFNALVALTADPTVVRVKTKQ